MAKKERYYVVWNGVTPGVYSSWTDCQLQIKGYKGAEYKSFPTREEAELAYRSGPEMHYTPPTALTPPPGTTEAAPILPAMPRLSPSPGTSSGGENALHTLLIGGKVRHLPASVQTQSLAVDAACSGNPGKMEYRGVYLADGQEKFHFGPMLGTNNIGEFLAIVHGLALLKQKNLSMPIYSDSRTALSWVKQKKCKTLLSRTAKTEELFQYIERAETWLRNNTYTTPILKWETKLWGEIPADFGRK